MNIFILAGYSKSLINFNGDLIKEMVSYGHNIYCAGPEIEVESELKAMGAQFIHIPFNRFSVNPLSGLKLINILIKIMKQYDIDLFYGYTAVPVVYGVVAAHYAKVRKIFAAITGAGKITEKRDGFYNRFIKLVLSLLMRFSLSHCDKVFFLNDDNIEYFVSHGIVRKENCVKTNGSGVNLNRFYRYGMPKNDSFLFVGSLLKYKGIIEYMEAARIVRRKYPWARFVVVGSIDKRLSAITEEELNTYIHEGTIIYEGFQRDVRPFLHACRYFVLPSYSEGVPTCVLEAMSIGRPIITTFAPGCKDTVINGENGFLVPVANIEALAEKMIWCIEHPYEVEKMALSSRNLVEEKFDVKIVNHIMLSTMGVIK